MYVPVTLVIRTYDVHDYNTEWHSLTARRHSTLVGGCNEFSPVRDVGYSWCGYSASSVCASPTEQGKAVVRPIILLQT